MTDDYYLINFCDRILYEDQKHLKPYVLKSSETLLLQIKQKLQSLLGSHKSRLILLIYRYNI